MSLPLSSSTTDPSTPDVEYKFPVFTSILLPCPIIPPKEIKLPFKSDFCDDEEGCEHDFDCEVLEIIKPGNFSLKPQCKVEVKKEVEDILIIEDAHFSVPTFQSPQVPQISVTLPYTTTLTDNNVSQNEKVHQTDEEQVSISSPDAVVGVSNASMRLQVESENEISIIEELAPLRQQSLVLVSTPGDIKLTSLETSIDTNLKALSNQSPSCPVQPGQHVTIQASIPPANSRYLLRPRPPAVNYSEKKYVLPIELDNMETDEEAYCPSSDSSSGESDDENENRGRKSHKSCRNCSSARRRKQNSEQSTRFNSKSHNSDKLHSCTRCDKKFAKKGNLKLHMLIHEGVKPEDRPSKIVEAGPMDGYANIGWWIQKKMPHICQECKKGFERKSYLDRHQLRVHERNKAVHVCPEPECKRKFTLERYLKLHVLTVHPKFKPLSPIPVLS